MRKATLVSLATIILTMALPNFLTAHEIKPADFDAGELKKITDQLAKDKTDEISYNESHKHPEFDKTPRKYQCGQFARDVQWNMWKGREGVYSNIVGATYVRITNGQRKTISHAFLEVKLKGKDGKQKTVYVEAQNDKIHTTPINLVRGLKPWHNRQRSRLQI